MHRNLSTALRRLSHASSPDHILSATHLCKSCQSLIITRDLIKNIPVSQLPNGRKALDLLHGFIDLPTKKKDESPEFPQLKMSASMGCEFCGALFEAIQWERETFKDDWRWKHSNAEVMIKFRYCCGPDLGLGSFEAGRWPTILSALEALVYRKDHVNDTNPLVIVFKASCDADSIVGDYFRIRRRPIDVYALSPNNLRMVKTWIQECRNNHFACSPLANVSPPARPTRLVFVGDYEHSVLPRLVMGQYLPENLRFAALSYCWGPPSSMRLVTTRQTLTSRLSGIEWEDIPRTFFDAFLAAKMLGLEYVWIDALCIIQDDERDWQVEAAMMGDIYRGAQITFVAASSRSTNDGFLGERIPGRQNISIPYSDKYRRGNYSVTFSENGYKEKFSEDIETSKWNTRGWTFQERQLSRRALFFGRHGLYFECRMHRCMEGYDGRLNRSLALYKHMQSTDSWDVLHLSWRKMVEEYSGRSFTFAKDRLPALSGLAKEIILQADTEAGKNREYLGGHWRQSLQLDLTWIGRSGAIERNEIWDQQHWEEGFQYPTWSWSTYPGRVVWPKVDTSETIEPMCEVERASTQPKSVDPLGQVMGGFVDIVGPLAEIEVPQPFFQAQRVWADVRVNVIAKIDISGHVETNKVSITDNTWWATGVEYCLQFAIDTNNSIGDSAWIALTSEITHVSSDKSDFYYGLVLKSAGKQSWKSPAGGIEVMRESFYRIGVFRKSKKSTGSVYHNVRVPIPPSGYIDSARGFRKCRYRLI